MRFGRPSVSRGEHLGGPAGAEQLGHVVLVAAGRKHRQAADVGPDHQPLGVERRIGERVDEAGALGLEAEDVEHLGLGEIGVDEQHFHVALAGQRQSQVDGAEGLALVGLGRADQDRPPLVGGDRASRAHSEQELPLDDPELLGERPRRAVRDDEAALPERIPVRPRPSPR